MNRSGRCGSMLGKIRVMWSRFADEALSAGEYVPESRKVLILLSRNRDEADGDRSMIGSGLRPAFLGRLTSAGLEDMLAAVEDCWPVRGRLRPRNISADFRTWEKSCCSQYTNTTRWGNIEILPSV